MRSTLIVSTLEKPPVGNWGSLRKRFDDRYGRAAVRPFATRIHRSPIEL